MASSKPDLARAGTMDVTAKEGSAFLDKNLTEWKKPYLMPGSGDATATASSASTPKLAKHTTMKGTAQEAEALLGSNKPDADAQTRGQQKKIEEINAEQPPAKKSKLAKDNTMVATAKEAKSLLGGEKLADTRQETKSRQKKTADLKRVTTMDKTKAEAELIYGKLDLSGGRSLRKRPAPPPKPAMKRAGTMQKTAKEGKAYLKRGKKAAKKAEAEKIEEEKEDEEEEEEEEAKA